MRSAIVGFVAGVAWIQTCARLPDPTSLAATALVALLLLAIGRNILGSLVAGAMLGLCWAALLAHLALADALARDEEGRDLTVVGTIDSLPYAFEQGVRFNFRVEQVETPAGAVPRRLALSWYAGFRDQAKPGEPVGDVRPGERWRLTVRLQRPHGSANPQGFDYEVWLLEQGVRATGYVRPAARGSPGSAGEAAAGNVRLSSFVFSVNNVVEHCRAVLRARILAALPGRPYAGVIVALVVGDQRAIDQADWQVFARTGVSHLISISGLHITMVAGMAAWLMSSLWRRLRWPGGAGPRPLALILPAQKVAALTGFVVALLYVLLAGFGVPAQRTLYMLAVLALALWSGRLSGVSHVLCAALGVVVLLDPWAVLAPGFWLSFGAVAMILYASVGRTVVRMSRKERQQRQQKQQQSGAAPQPWRERLAAMADMAAPALRTQYVVTLGLAPLTLLLFSQISLVSPLANAVAIPLISFVVTPLALVGSLLPAPVSNGVLILAHGAVELLAILLTWLGSARLAVWAAPTPSIAAFGLAMAGTAWLLAPRGWPARWAGLAAWAPALGALPQAPPPGAFTATVFDVGQGMALLIETAGHRLLYDAGPWYSPDSNGGNRVIAPYLKARGIAHLDAMVISHSDADHAGGGPAVFDAVPVDLLLSSLSSGHPLVRRAPVARPCVAGQRWQWDGVSFDMLHPMPDSYGDAALKSNARSCTLRISSAGATPRTLLAAGDIEAAQEAQLLARTAALPAEVLLAPHHGSGTSSTAGFLRAVHPGLAVFQVGYRNRYHHPKPAVWERYGDAGIMRMRTDEAGAITLQFDSRVTASSYRLTHARYWYDK